MNEKIEQKDRKSVEEAYRRVIEFPRANITDLVETLQLYLKAHDAGNNSVVEHKALKRLRDLVGVPQP